MKMHAIIEIEEGTMNVVVGGRDGGRTRVVRSLRMPLADLGTATVENALRTIGSDMLQGASGVHVVLGDRRAQHFLSILPAIAPRDAVAFVTREALRLANVPSSEEILVSTRLLCKLPGNKLQLAASAIARSVWTPIHAAFDARSLPVLSLQTMESCLAMATDASTAEPVAMLECNGGKARYVVCVNQAPVQVRRFMIGGGGEHNESALMTQLAMELPRTLDWLRETNQALPQQLWLGSRVVLADESLHVLASDETGEARRTTALAEWGDDQAAPSIGVAALLHRLSSGVKTASLLDAPKLRLPMSVGHYVTVFAAACVAVMGAYSAVIDGSAWMNLKQDHQRIAAECQEAQNQLTQRDMEDGQHGAVDTNSKLGEALSMRRPLSRLIGELSNSAGEEISIEEVKFASKSPIVVSGVVEGTNRRHALSAMGAFTEKVHAMPFIVAGSQDEMSEVDGHANRFRFRLSLAWRTK